MKSSGTNQARKVLERKHILQSTMDFSQNLLSSQGRHLLKTPSSELRKKSGLRTSRIREKILKILGDTGTASENKAAKQKHTNQNNKEVCLSLGGKQTFHFTEV